MDGWMETWMDGWMIGWRDVVGLIFARTKKENGWMPCSEASLTAMGEVERNATDDLAGTPAAHLSRSEK